MTPAKDELHLLILDGSTAGHPEARRPVAPTGVRIDRLASDAEARAYAAEARRTDALPDLLLVDFAGGDLGPARRLAGLRRLPPLDRLPVVAMVCDGDAASIRRAYDFGAQAVIADPGAAARAGDWLRPVIDLWRTGRLATVAAEDAAGD